MFKKTSMIILSVMVFLSLGCGSNKKSGRDARREQIRNNAESKRKELNSVVGHYYGNLISENGKPKGVTLNLEIKDVPQEEEGEVDPIMVPTLSGYVKFNYGLVDNAEGEQINFKLSRANYDAKTGRIDFIASNEAYKDIVMTLQNKETGDISGDWSAPNISKSGEISFSKSIESGGEAKLHDYISPAIAGEYQGFIDWEKKGIKQLTTLTLVSAIKPPDGISLGATVRVFWGDINSNEFVTYNYDEVQFNPIDGRLTVKDSSGSDVTFSGALSNGIYAGRWSNRYDGDVGECYFQKNNKSTNIEESAALILEGEYRGAVFWEKEQEFQHTIFTVVSTTDEQNQLQLNVTAKLIFGELNSEEYMSFEFPSAKYNPWTDRLILQRDDSEFSFVGTVTDGEINGAWSSNYRGNMGGVKLSKVAEVSVSHPYERITALKGIFQGSLENTKPNTNLPERFQIGFITSRDLNQPNGIKISGSIRFYLGEFGSLEYVETDLESIRFNFFTRELIGVTKDSDAGRFTIIARVEPSRIIGKLFEDALGEVANIEVNKI